MKQNKLRLEKDFKSIIEVKKDTKSLNQQVFPSIKKNNMEGLTQNRSSAQMSNEVIQQPLKLKKTYSLQTNVPILQENINQTNLTRKKSFKISRKNSVKSIPKNTSEVPIKMVEKSNEIIFLVNFLIQKEFIKAQNDFIYLKKSSLVNILNQFMIHLNPKISLKTSYDKLILQLSNELSKQFTFDQFVDRLNKEKQNQDKVIFSNYEAKNKAVEKTLFDLRQNLSQIQQQVAIHNKNLINSEQKLQIQNTIINQKSLELRQIEHHLESLAKKQIDEEKMTQTISKNLEKYSESLKQLKSYAQQQDIKILKLAQVQFREYQQDLFEYAHYLITVCSDQSYTEETNNQVATYNLEIDKRMILLPALVVGSTEPVENRMKTFTRFITEYRYLYTKIIETQIKMNQRNSKEIRTFTKKVQDLASLTTYKRQYLKHVHDEYAVHCLEIQQLEKKVDAKMECQSCKDLKAILLNISKIATKITQCYKKLAIFV